MNKHTVVVKTSIKDVDIKSNTTNHLINFISENHKNYYENSLWLNRDIHHLNYHPIAVDLYRLAASVFIIDKTISRNTAYDGWTRDILLYLPVKNLELWEKNTDKVVSLLNFMTGDHWQIVFKKDYSEIPPVNTKLYKRGCTLEAKKVCLFSGGLDSFIGAIDSIIEYQSIALISHYDQPHTCSLQKKLFDEIKQHYPSYNLNLIQFLLRTPDTKENTTRSRSMIFFTLGVLIASSLGIEELIIPENGFISLNVPLTTLRLGSLTTKTTHPNTLYIFNNLLTSLGIKVKLVNPYQFKTKGEMLKESKDFPFVSKYGKETMSCAHPTVGRWLGKKPNSSCGYCYPCLIRRSAFFKISEDDASYYENNVLDKNFLKQDSKKNEDIRAVLYAIEKHNSIPNFINVTRSGHIPNKNDLDNLCRVYGNGIEELSNFLSIYIDKANI